MTHTVMAISAIIFLHASMVNNGISVTHILMKIKLSPKNVDVTRHAPTALNVFGIYI